MILGDGHAKAGIYWPHRRSGCATLKARAQQTMPVIGFLDTASPGSMGPFLTMFRQGLFESGFVEGRNVTVEYRWGENHNDRLPALAADLVEQHVAVIA